jgi:manganese efflux pump family protein
MRRRSSSAVRLNARRTSFPESPDRAGSGTLEWMTVLRILTIIALVLPLATDTFVLSTALRVAGLEKRERFRTSLVLTGFEAGMPVVGFLVGAALGSIIGRSADYFAAVVFAVTGAWMLWPRGSDEVEEQNVRLLESARGWAILVLGLSISLDELAIGFGVGLLGLPLILLVSLIAVQAFIAAQLGMRLGSRIAEKARGAGEQFAGALLVLAAAIAVLETLPKT